MEGKDQKLEPQDHDQEESDDSEDLLSKSFLGISRSMNHYGGLRCNAALDVLAGPSPSDLMPEIVIEQNGEDASRFLKNFYFEKMEDRDPDSEPAILERLEEMPLSQAEEALIQSFSHHCALPSSKFEINCLVPDRMSCPGVRMLEESQIYGFLKKDSRIQKLFRETWKSCSEDLAASVGKPRAGVAGDLIHYNRNEFRLAISAIEHNGGVRVEACFYMNEKDAPEE